jgi:hypothetical protein
MIITALEFDVSAFRASLIIACVFDHCVYVIVEIRVACGAREASLDARMLGRTHQVVVLPADSRGFDGRAGIHDHVEAGRPGPERGRFVDDAYLQPQRADA